MLKLGILGAGRVVQNRYVDVFQHELKNVKVTKVCDLVQKNANDVADSLSAEAVYSSEALFTSKDISTILIATESGKHYEHTKKALSEGKHVIVEKPPTLLPDQIVELEEMARTKGLMYAVIFQNRFNPAIRILKKTFDTGRLGKIVTNSIRLRWCRYQEYYEDGWHGTWKMDGGVINQQAIHHVDALQWICGPVISVCAAQTNILNKLEAEDTHVAILRFVSGALGIVEATTAARPKDYEASISIVGEKGMAVINGIALNKIDTWEFVDSIPEDKIIPSQYSQEVPTGYGLSHGPLIQEIVDRLQTGNIKPPITGTDALPTVQLVHALYKSDELNGWVDLKNTPISGRLGI